MPNHYTAPAVKYGTTSSTVYSLTGIQTITLTSGRRNATDTFSSSQLNIELIPANSYTLALKVGQYISVLCTNEFGPFYAFKGYIDSVARSYGNKYTVATGAAPEDRIYISASCAIGQLAKYTVKDFSNNVTNTSSGIANIAAEAGVTVTELGDVQRAASSTDLQTGSVLDFVNQYARTAQCYVMAKDDKEIALRDPANGAGITNWSFSDAPTNAYQLKMSALEYEASVYNSTTRVVVEPADFSPQDAWTGTAPFYSYQFSSFDASNTAAEELAGYIVNLNNETAQTPVSVTTRSSIQGTTVNALDWPQSPTELAEFIGTVADITFRGSTVLAICEGFTAVWGLDDFSFTGYFSPSLGVPFILDSDSFGILDQNRLAL